MTNDEHATPAAAAAAVTAVTAPAVSLRLFMAGHVFQSAVSRWEPPLTAFTKEQLVQRFPISDEERVAQAQFEAEEAADAQERLDLPQQHREALATIPALQAAASAAGATASAKQAVRDARKEESAL